MPTAKEKNSVTRTGDGAGGTPAARRRKPSTVGEAATAGPVRGYTKLSNAAKAFHYNFDGKVVLDIGSSTGGFTEYALEKGAKKVIAVEKGTNQMLPRIRNNPRVELHEKTDIFDVVLGTGDRNVFASDHKLGRTALSVSEENTFGQDPFPDIILADVSFISLTKILNHAKTNLASKNTEFLVMLKPQFEADEKQLHSGIVKNETIRRNIIKNFEQWLKQNGFIILKKKDNELKGKNGNLERFYYLTLEK